MGPVNFKANTTKVFILRSKDKVLWQVMAKQAMNGLQTAM
jgi:hypothetical protein